jgi:hypothetical protein
MNPILHIEDISVGDLAITRQSIYKYTYGGLVIGEGQIIKIVKIKSKFSKAQNFRYHIISIKDRNGNIYNVTWKQLRNKIIIKNK